MHPSPLLLSVLEGTQRNPDRIFLIIWSQKYLACLIFGLYRAADTLSMLENYNSLSLTVGSGDLPELAASNVKAENTLSHQGLSSTSLCIPTAVCLFTCHRLVWKHKRPCMLFKGSFGKQGIFFFLHWIQAAVNSGLPDSLCSAVEAEKRKNLTHHSILLLSLRIWILHILAQGTQSFYPFPSSFSQHHQHLGMGFSCCLEKLGWGWGGLQWRGSLAGRGLPGRPVGF